MMPAFSLTSFREWGPWVMASRSTGVRGPAFCHVHLLTPSGRTNPGFPGPMGQPCSALLDFRTPLPLGRKMGPTAGGATEGAGSVVWTAGAMLGLETRGEVPASCGVGGEGAWHREGRPLRSNLFMLRSTLGQPGRGHLRKELF